MKNKKRVLVAVSVGTGLAIFLGIYAANSLQRDLEDYIRNELHTPEKIMEGYIALNPVEFTDVPGQLGVLGKDVALEIAEKLKVEEVAAHDKLKENLLYPSLSNEVTECAASLHNQRLEEIGKLSRYSQMHMIAKSDFYKSIDRLKQNNSKYLKCLTLYHNRYNNKSLTTSSVPTSNENQLQQALIHAVKDGQIDFVRTALRQGSNVNSRYEYGSTALHHAVAKGYLSVAQALIEAGADVNARAENGTTPLQWAIGEGRLDLAQLLVENKADINAKDGKGNTPLADAAFLGSFEIASLLIDRGAEINSTDTDGHTPLHWANSYEHHGIAQLLLQKGGVDQ